MSRAEKRDCTQIIVFYANESSLTFKCLRSLKIFKKFQNFARLFLSLCLFHINDWFPKKLLTRHISEMYQIRYNGFSWRNIAHKRGIFWTLTIVLLPLVILQWAASPVKMSLNVEVSRKTVARECNNQHVLDYFPSS